MKQTIEKYYCDRCKKEIPEATTKPFFYIGLSITRIQRQLLSKDKYVEDYEFCEDCGKSFEKWMSDRQYG